MKISSTFFGLIFLLTFFCFQNAEAGFNNAGRMQSKNLHLSIGGTLDNSGELIGTESAYISCDTITGKGAIRSPQIQLEAAIFAFTGTIDCSGKCTIVTSKSFDERMFKRTGGGEFTVVIDENLGKRKSKEIAEELLNNDTVTDGLEVVTE